MKESIVKRLEKIEELYRDDPLIVIAITDNGEEIKMPMRECLERDDVEFKKVIGGSSLKDLDALLQAHREAAFKELDREDELEGEEYFEDERTY